MVVTSLPLRLLLVAIPFIQVQAPTQALWRWVDSVIRTRVSTSVK